jgi:hypothetical protein
LAFCAALTVGLGVLFFVVRAGFVGGGGAVRVARATEDDRVDWVGDV